MVKSGNYEEYIDEYKSICLERYKENTNEIIISYIENSGYENVLINSIWSEVKIYEKDYPVSYIGKTIWEYDRYEEIEQKNIISIEDNTEGVIIGKISQGEKINIEEDIKIFLYCLPEEIQKNIDKVGFFWL